jgi:streptomycin 6-kinase
MTDRMATVASWSLPRNLLAAARRDGREAWLATLPGIVRELEDRWSLTVGRPFEPGGQTAWVAPVLGSAGTPLVLKVLWWHTEAMHEAEALRMWDGDGAVRVQATAVFENTVAILMERCVPGTSLARRPEPEQDLVVAGLLRRLWKQPPPGHPFRSLQVMCDQWADEFEQKAAHERAVLDAGLARDGIALLRALPGSADRHVLLCTDLHADNVLAAEREPWLLIDPKPYLGDPTYDLVQHLLNCRGHLRADPHGLVRRVAALVDLDAERLLLWLFARCVQESLTWPSLAEVARRIAPA